MALRVKFKFSRALAATLDTAGEEAQASADAAEVAADATATADAPEDGMVPKKHSVKFRFKRSAADPDAAADGEGEETLADQPDANAADADTERRERRRKHKKDKKHKKHKKHKREKHRREASDGCSQDDAINAVRGWYGAPVSLEAAGVCRHWLQHVTACPARVRGMAAWTHGGGHDAWRP